MGVRTSKCHIAYLVRYEKLHNTLNPFWPWWSGWPTGSKNSFWPPKWHYFHINWSNSATKGPNSFKLAQLRHIQSAYKCVKFGWKIFSQSWNNDLRTHTFFSIYNLKLLELHWVKFWDLLDFTSHYTWLSEYVEKPVHICVFGPGNAPKVAIS